MPEVPQLPMPERLEPVATSRTLMMNVRIYFYQLYNSTNAKFRGFLASVGNEDSKTKNRMFDRYNAVEMIKDQAKEARDTATVNAPEGLIWKCMVKLLATNGLGLKIRRQEYKRLTHQQTPGAPAE